MMASLRSRLIALLLALSAAGLIVLALVTYAEQRSFLSDRLDQQAHVATAVVSRALDGDDHAATPADGGGPDAGAHSVPSGTYGELRDASGRILAGGYLYTYGTGSSTTTTTRLGLPAKLQDGDTRTVSAGGARYRVVATRDVHSGKLAVAAVPLREVDQTLQRLLLVEALVIAGVLLLLGLVAWFVVRGALRPLDRMGQTAGAIAGGDLSRRIADDDARTEVGRLGGALNVMLDRLERAFSERQASEDRLRRFLADASHELRTPLASVRGYAELFRMGAARQPAETERAMGRIEAEAARMGVLVEDLLTLARLDQVPEVVHDEVDLEVLARDAADDGVAMAPDRDISVTADGSALVHGDADQLRQVLANLIRNALVHTPDGTPVDVDVSFAGDEVRLEVRDHGLGLPTQDADELFERFWRAEGGRERGKAGAGLGLAIVAQIVRAHGGRVTAADAPGGGARFLVTLPAAQEAPRESPALAGTAHRS